MMSQARQQMDKGGVWQGCRQFNTWVTAQDFCCRRHNRRIWVHGKNHKEILDPFNMQADGAKICLHPAPEAFASMGGQHNQPSIVKTDSCKGDFLPGLGTRQSAMQCIHHGVAGHSYARREYAFVQQIAAVSLGAAK